MASITPRSGPGAFHSPDEIGPIVRRDLPPPPRNDQRDSAQRDSMEALYAARREAMRLESFAAANSNGLGSSAEEITFGASERAELETHDDTRDAEAHKAERVEALMRVEALREMMRQLKGDRQFSTIQSLARDFAARWTKGESERAMAALEDISLSRTDKEVLFRLAIDKLPKGEKRDELEAHLRSLDGDVRDRRVIDRLMTSRTWTPADGLTGAPNAASLLQTPPTHKSVLEAALAGGPNGARQLESAMAVSSRVDPRLSRGTEVFLSLTLIRMIQQIGQVERASVEVLNAASSKRQISPDDIVNTTRWLLDTTLAASPKTQLARMPKVLKADGVDLQSARNQMLQQLNHLPPAVWGKDSTKEEVRTDLREAVTAFLERTGEITRTGGTLRTGGRPSIR